MERNGLKDSSLANILSGLQDRKLKTLSLINNEMSFMSKPLIEGLMRDLTCLRLNELKGPPQVLQQMIPSVLNANNLTQLTISGNNLSHKSAFDCILEFFEYSQTIERVDLSWSFLTTKHLIQLVDAIMKQRKRIKDLNIAYNTCDVFGADADSKKFVDKLSKFIKKAHKLVHLDLSGLQLGHQAAGLIQPIRQSESLCVIHLSNNQIPRNTKNLLYNLFGQSVYATKQAARNTQITLSIQDSKQTQGSAQAKIINHHIMKSVKAGVNKSQTHQKEIDRVQSSDTFIIQRFLGFPELSSKTHCDADE